MLSVKSSKILFTVAILITVIFVIISIYIFTREKECSEKVEATIRNADCEEIVKNGKKTKTYDCELLITYIPKNEDTEANNKIVMPISKTKYKRDDKIKIYHNAKYNRMISIEGQTNTWGYILITLSIIIVLVAYMLLLKAKRFEEFYRNMN